MGGSASCEWVHRPPFQKTILLVLPSWAMHRGSVLAQQTSLAPQTPISCGLGRSVRAGQIRAHTCSVHQRSRLDPSLRSAQLHSSDRDRKAICKNIKDWMHLKSLMRGWQMIPSKVEGSVSYKYSWPGTLIQENSFLNKERSIKKKIF